jgi:hypothetical protein
MITSGVRRICETKSRIVMAKAAFSTKKTFLTSKQDLNLRKVLVKCYIWSIALYSDEMWTLQKVNKKYLEIFEIWCLRRVEKVTRTDNVRNEEVSHRVKEETSILHTIKRRKPNWIGHILHRTCLLKHVIAGRIETEIEVTGRQGRRRKQLLDDFGKRENTGN